MKPVLLDYCKCPGCADMAIPLEIANAVYRNGEVFSGTLVCKQGHRFAISNYIPDFVDPEDAVTQNSHIYDSIWDAHQKETYAGRIAEYTRKFQEFARLPGEVQKYFENKTILDVGCGNGRFSYLASALSASHVVGIDYSVEALHRAIVSTGNPPHCSFIRANVLRMPLLPKFDFVFSMGVLHHTPDTKQAYLEMVQLLKPGGYVSLYVYGKCTLPFITWPLRLMTLHMNKEIILKWCRNFGFTYDAAIIPWFALRDFFGRFKKLDVLGVNRLTFEGLTTPYLWEHSLKEVKSWFKETNVELISSTNILSATGRLKSAEQPLI